MLVNTPVLLLMAGIVVLAVVVLILRFASSASRQGREFDLWLSVPFLRFRLLMGAPPVAGGIPAAPVSEMAQDALREPVSDYTKDSELTTKT